MTTVGFPIALGDLLTNNLQSVKASDFSIGYMQLGTSSNVDYVDRNFYELSSPISFSQYGKFTNLNIQNEDLFQYPLLS